MHQFLDVDLHFVNALRAQAQSVLTSWENYGAVCEMLATFSDLRFFLAGGVLRDIALENQRAVQDFDFFFSGEKKEVVTDFLRQKGAIEAGPFGSPRWYPPSGRNRYADVIPITGFYNGLWQCKDINDVLNQFDFTANAIGIDIRTLKLFGPQNALRDLRARVMRAVRFDYPDEPISPNCPLTRPCVLWFRLLHYAGELGLAIEPVTRKWLVMHLQYESLKGDFSHYFFAPNLSALSAIR